MKLITKTTDIEVFQTGSGSSYYYLPSDEGDKNHLSPSAAVAYAALEHGKVNVTNRQDFADIAVLDED